METKFISHEEALRIRQQNNQIQKNLIRYHYQA